MCQNKPREVGALGIDATAGVVGLDANGSLYSYTPTATSPRALRYLEWILGEQASDPRCAPDHRNTTLKVHVGPVSSHVANWKAVEETLRGTRYEHFLLE